MMTKKSKTRQLAKNDARLGYVWIAILVRSEVVRCFRGIQANLGGVRC